MASWENLLAFRGEPVTISREGQPDLHGTLVGLDDDGSLRLETDHHRVLLEIGDLHLRPSSDKMA
jgi:biotin-(acetyl-CoA carboxylase) ligase